MCFTSEYNHIDGKSVQKESDQRVCCGEDGAKKKKIAYGDESNSLSKDIKFFMIDILMSY